MAQAEQPERLRPQYRVSVDDVRQLMGASTPHFALQLRNRIRTLIAGLEPRDPARRLGEQEIARLERLGVTGEIRGEGFQDGQRPLPSLDGSAAAFRLRPGASPRRRVNGSRWGSRWAGGFAAPGRRPRGSDRARSPRASATASRPADRGSDGSC